VSPISKTLNTPNDRTILITGVTGHQGGAVAQALKSSGFRLRGMTRKPESEQAAALARHGVDVVKGDLDDEATLRRALAGAWGVFGVQNTWEAGVEREEAQGKRLATLAREAGVEHYVYTSVGSAHKRTGVPHFDNKWRIEETVRGLRFPSHVILRPVENLLAPFSLQGDTLSAALGPGTKLQMIAVDDIGWFGARAFTDAAALNRREIDIAGDLRTMPEAAEILTKALGRPIAFAQTPIAQVRQYSEDTALMLEWFERVGYSADIAGLEREFGRALTKLADWARGRDSSARSRRREGHRRPARHGQRQQGRATRNRSTRTVRRAHGERIATRRRDIRSRHPRRRTGTVGTSGGLAARRSDRPPARWLVQLWLRQGVPPSGRADRRESGSEDLYPGLSACSRTSISGCHG
jgi:uncharacterized protein YbjT (DUF2867 family)